MADLGSFELHFDGQGGAVMTRQQGVYVELPVGVDGSPETNPPGTIQARTLSAFTGPAGGCPAGQNCFAVELRNFYGQALRGVYMGIDSITPAGSPPRALVSPDAVPPGVQAARGGRNFGDLAEGAASVRALSFTVPDAGAYTIRGRYWGDNARGSRSYTGPAPITVQATAQYGVNIPITFLASDFEAGALVGDVNAIIRFHKTAGTCAAPTAGDAVHRETSFRLRAPNGTTVSLARSSPAPSTWAGSLDTPVVTVTFDSQAAAAPAVPAGPPVSGSFRPHGTTMDTFNGLSPVGTWNLQAGSGNAPLCVESVTLVISALGRRGPAPIVLGASTNLAAPGAYVLLAESGITNTTGSMITGGHLGVSPIAATAITGFSLTADPSNVFSTSPSVASPGRVYAANYASPTPTNLTTAVNAMRTAYTDGAGRSNPDAIDLLSGNIGGQTLVPGLYRWGSTVNIASNLTLSGGVNDTWIFQISNDLDLAAAARIILSGGAQARNVFWVVAGQATIRPNAHFEGIILSSTGITLQTRATMRGRALAQTLIALDDNAVTAP